MAHIFFIGGASRVGKSQLAVKALSQHHMLGTSTDALRKVVRGLTIPTKEPALFAVDSQAVQLSMAARIEQQNAESRALWPSIMRYIQSNYEDGFDVLIEGIAVLPELLQQCPIPYSVVLLGNTSPAHEPILMKHAQQNTYDWLHNKNKTYMRNHAAFVRAFSRHIRDESKRYHMPYIEMSAGDYDVMQTEALKALFGSLHRPVQT